MADPFPSPRPARRGPVPVGLLAGIALVALGLGIAIGWRLFGGGGSGDLAAMCASLATIEEGDLGGVESTGESVDPVVYRVSAISDLALAAAREQPDLDPGVGEAGAAMRAHVAQRDIEGLAADLATLRQAC